MSSPLAAGGQLLDIAGALALAWALVFKRPESARAESRSGFGGENPVLFLSLTKQTADAWVGGALLASGFFAQLLSSAGVRPAWLCLPLALGGAVAIAAAALVWLRFGLRPWNVRRSIRLDLTEGWREAELRPAYSEHRAQQWWLRLTNWATADGVERRPGEPLDELGRRLLGDRGWDRVLREVEPPPPPADI